VLVTVPNCAAAAVDVVAGHENGPAQFIKQDVKVQASLVTCKVQVQTFMSEGAAIEAEADEPEKPRRPEASANIRWDTRMA